MASAPPATSWLKCSTGASFARRGIPPPWSGTSPKAWADQAAGSNDSEGFQMAATTYDDAVSAALERLGGVGYEWGPSFVNHAPMAAEALARLGYTDDVPGWVEHNIRMRHYYDPPEPR